MSNLKEKETQKLREFSLSSFAVDNKITVFLLTFMIVLFGFQSYMSTPKEAFPEVPFPQVYINTVYFGNSAADIENLVTRPLEKELATIAEIKTLTSSSLQDFSIIIAEFEATEDIDDATRKVKDAVDKARSELPDDLTSEPDVRDVNLAELPIMTINLSGNYSNDELKSFAEYLEDEVEELKEISSVDIKGAREREVSIEVDLPKMESMQVAFSDIENAVKTENLNMSGGEVLSNGSKRNLRVVGEFENVEQLENMIVKSENQMPIVLKDFAEVVYGYKERTSIARSDRLPVISLDVIKRKGENLLAASDKIKIAVDDAKNNVFPSDLKVSIFNDQSRQTRNSVSNLENSIISGVILVVLVLLFFIGTRNSLFVGIAIPLSMLLGIMIVSLLGYTMNMVVLFALILALGMLVDNAIVVVENIYRYVQNGYESSLAAKYGTGEVAIPIIASTATTLAAFVPLAFWPGIMGQFMKFLPITLIAVLTSSLFVALVINPVFTSRFMIVDTDEEDPAVKKRKRRNVFIGVFVMLLIALVSGISKTEWLRNLMVIAAIISILNLFVLGPGSKFFQARVLPLLENAYDWFVRFALKGINPTLTFFGTFVLLFVALGLMAVFPPKTVFFPEPDPNYVNAFVELPLGKDIEETNKLMKELEVKIEKAIEPYTPIVDAVLSQIGENTSDPSAGPSFGSSPQKARLTVSFVPSEERGDLSTVDAMNAIREAVKGNPGVQIVVDKEASGPPTGKPINLEITGENIDELTVLATNVKAYLDEKNVPGVEELKLDVQLGKQEVLIHIDREAARRYGASTYAIADVIRTAVFGKELSKYKVGEDEYEIQLRANDAYRYNVDQILNQRITFRSPATGQIVQVPVSAVTNIEYTSTYNSINRKDQERMVTISSNVLDGFNANEIVAEMKESMREYDMPNGFAYQFTGEQEDMAENMAFLTSALMVAVFAIFLIIVTQFNSIISPFIIILSVLFSTIGVFLGYVGNGMDIVVIMTGIGIISLAGIVVNNAIVLIDYTNLLVGNKRRSLGLASMYDMDPDDIKEAIIKAGSTRLRPVLLTAITTVLGLVPLAIGFNFNFFTFISRLDPQFFIGGDNAAFWGTMAWTVIYGLVFATFLTLVVVPVMYWLAYRGNALIKGLFK